MRIIFCLIVVVYEIFLDGCYMVSGPFAGESCKLPFTNNGKTYHECTYDLSDNGNPWCSARVDSNGNHIQGNWGDCNSNCPTEIQGKMIWNLTMCFVRYGIILLINRNPSNQLSFIKLPTF